MIIYGVFTKCFSVAFRTGRNVEMKMINISIINSSGLLLLLLVKSEYLLHRLTDRLFKVNFFG